MFLHLPAAAALALGLLVAAAPARAAGERIPTEQELALLPPYCPYTQTIGKPDYSSPDAVTALWMNRFGKDYFWRLHHYCYALVAEMRAERVRTSDPNMYKHELGIAAGEYEFIRERFPPDHFLLPELYLKRGRVLLKMGKDRDALELFEKSIQAKADYWPAYASLSDYHRDRGDKAKALATLEAGLKNAPDARALQRRQRELLGGKTDARSRASSD